MSKRLCHFAAVGLSCVALAACQTLPEGPSQAVEVVALEEPVEPPAPPFDPTLQARKDLEDAQGVYAEGRYDEAVRQLSALATDSGLPMPLRTTAMKFMAFSQCALNRLRLCRQQFDAALELDPTFQLSEAEKGHPVWGREFRNALHARKAALAKGSKRPMGKPAMP